MLYICGVKQLQIMGHHCVVTGGWSVGCHEHHLLLAAMSMPAGGGYAVPPGPGLGSLPVPPCNLQIALAHGTYRHMPIVLLSIPPGGEYAVSPRPDELPVPPRQTLFFSATWPKEVQAIARRLCRNDPVQVFVGNVQVGTCATPWESPPPPPPRMLCVHGVWVGISVFHRPPAWRCTQLPVCKQCRWRPLSSSGVL